MALGKFGKFVKEHPYETATVAIILVFGIFVLAKKPASTSTSGVSDAVMQAEIASANQQAQQQAQLQAAAQNATAAIQVATIQGQTQVAQVQGAVDIAGINAAANTNIATVNAGASTEIAKSTNLTNLGIATQQQVLGSNQAKYASETAVGVANASAQQAIQTAQAYASASTANTGISSVAGLIGALL